MIAIRANRRVHETEKNCSFSLFLLVLSFSVTHFIVRTSYVESSSSGTSIAGGNWRTFEEEAPMMRLRKLRETRNEEEKNETFFFVLKFFFPLLLVKRIQKKKGQSGEAPCF